MAPSRKEDTSLSFLNLRSRRRLEAPRKKVQVPANREIGLALAQSLPVLLDAGNTVPNQVEVVPDGLNGIAPGLEKLKNNLAIGKKLVVHVGETA
ncbi:hypothetical protein OG21DRAFT_1504916 [Imleria badia]|nr:hypothetical protein OG21DRAFT_1504916 [Imleria badia]